jgi:hypothetical protein
MTSPRAKVAFYLLSALPEWIVTAIYFSVDLNALFDLREAAWKKKVQKKMKKGKWPAGMGYVAEGEYKHIEGGGGSTYTSSSPTSYPPSAYNKV